MLFRPESRVKQLITTGFSGNLKGASDLSCRRYLRVLQERLKEGSTVIETNSAKAELVAAYVQSGLKGSYVIKNSQTLESVYAKWEKKYVTTQNPKGDNYFAKAELTPEAIETIKAVMLSWWGDKWYLSNKPHKLAYQVFDDRVIIPAEVFANAYSKLHGLEHGFNWFVFSMYGEKNKKMTEDKLIILRTQKRDELNVKYQFNLIQSAFVTDAYLSSFDKFCQASSMETNQAFMDEARNVIRSALTTFHKVRFSGSFPTSDIDKAVISAVRQCIRKQEKIYQYTDDLVVGARRFLEHVFELVRKNNHPKAETLGQHRYNKQLILNQTVNSYSKINREFNLGADDKNNHMDMPRNYT